MRCATIGGACCLVFLAACQHEGPAGPAIGGLPGIVNGSQVSSPDEATPIGAVQGGLLAADIGRSLTEADRQLAGRAEYEALEYARAGRPVDWTNPASGNSGKVIVGGTYQVNLLDCRSFSHTVLIGGRARVARGTACREPDDDWRVVN